MHAEVRGEPCKHVEVVILAPHREVVHQRSRGDDGVHRPAWRPCSRAAESRPASLSATSSS